MNKFEFFPFERCGIIRSRLPEPLFTEIKQRCDFIFNNKINHTKLNHMLAGNIEHEFSLGSNKDFDDFLLEMASFYYTVFGEKEKIKSVSIESTWVNFQKKHEFNPLHNHSGDLSFVAWIQIPYISEEEKSLLFAKNSRYNCVSDFYYKEYGRGIKNIQLSKQNEGEIIMFDALLPHGVYPFYTSDDYRISVAGNLLNDK